MAIQSNDGSSVNLSAFLVDAFLAYANYYVANADIQTLSGKAYPNPALEYVDLTLPKNLGDYTIQIVNMDGHQWQPTITYQSNDAIRLDTRALPVGNYTVLVTNNKQQVVYKIIR